MVTPLFDGSHLFREFTKWASFGQQPSCAISVNNKFTLLFKCKCTLCSILVGYRLLSWCSEESSATLQSLWFLSVFPLLTGSEKKSYGRILQSHSTSSGGGVGRMLRQGQSMQKAQHPSLVWTRGRSLMLMVVEGYVDPSRWQRRGGLGTSQLLARVHPSTAEAGISTHWASGSPFSFWKMSPNSPAKSLHGFMFHQQDLWYLFPYPRCHCVLPHIWSVLTW